MSPLIPLFNDPLLTIQAIVGVFTALGLLCVAFAD